MINKSDILNGAKQCKEITVEALNNETIFIRKLNDGEIAEITSIIVSGGKMVNNDGEMEVQISGEEAIKNTKRAKHVAIAYSLTNKENPDKWKPSEIAQLTSDVVQELGKKVAEYSGMLNTKTFRNWGEDG